MKVVLSGATGFIGKVLVQELLERGHELTVLTRRPGNSQSNEIKYVSWDARTKGGWTGSLEGAGAVVNLAGENIAGGRWTEDLKKRIEESRIFSTRALVEGIREAKLKPGTLVNASAVGYYGDVPSGDVTESSPPGEGFLPEICRKWEEEASKARSLGVRVVLLRFGVVLGKEGGALQKMLPPFKLFAGGPLGSGRQWVPWIHIKDAARLIVHALEKSGLEGPVNAAAPAPVTMKEFCRTLGKVLKRPCWAPVPEAALKALFGEMAEAVLLSGQRALPQKALETGYRFYYPSLEPALRHLLNRSL